MKKAILVPYACSRECRCPRWLDDRRTAVSCSTCPGDCEWAEEVFPNRPIAALPVCGKPIVAYALDELSKQAFGEVLILDRHYDRRLKDYLGDGGKWGMKVTYRGGDDVGDEQFLRARHADFIGEDETLIVFGNTVAGRRIASLKDFYETNLGILSDPRGCVVPGYSVEPGTFVGSDVVIRPGVYMKGPVCLGDSVRIARGARILPETVLGEGCVVDRGAKIGESVVFPGTYVGKQVELVKKIVVGSRVIDPVSGAYVDLDDGISESVESRRASYPATGKELRSVRYTHSGDPETETKLAVSLAGIAQDIALLRLPKLKGVYLGGGYGRGEGGSPLYNDLDFFPLVAEVTEAERAEIQVALDAIGAAYGSQLGIHVDFCRPKTCADFKRDERRIMVQELLRGHVPVFGGVQQLDFLRAFPPEELPASEALRTLVNRGMGLYLARDSKDRDFANRNINKAVLGAGDAVLVAKRRYRWEVVDRAAAVGEPEYARAVELKFHPTGESACDWATAAALWSRASQEVMFARGRELSGRSVRQGVRYVLRRRRIGRLSEFGLDPLLRILLPLEHAIAGGGRLDKETMKDWEVFN